MLIGHQKQWNFLKRLVESKGFSHAYLFAGQEKLGKKTLALELFSSFFGRDAQKNNHPDLIFIEAQKKEIQISQIRDLIWKFSLKPSVAPFKLAIIDNAHLMNQEAQTSLLKTLEEPGDSALLILITDKTQFLFPTVLSRLQIVKFYPVKKEEIRSHLTGQGLSEKEAEEISIISSGRPGVAIDFISDAEKLRNLRQKIDELKDIANAALCFRFQYAKDLAEDTQNFKNTLDIWLNCFRDILLSRFYAVNSNWQPEKGDFKRYPLAKLKKIINLIQTTKLIISTTNVNSRLALETLMLEF